VSGLAEKDTDMLDALLAQAKAEALRSQRDFFRAVDMPIAADHCEQAAIAWDHSRAIALDPGERGAS
jgi:predicted TPR repeat methyltransferase